eukprot:m.287077 g.287077  ORF g.287077 m.287077 type:complete len:73 (+) comp55009_c0_seq1:1147-1365(+)
MMLYLVQGQSVRVHLAARVVQRLISSLACLVVCVSLCCERSVRSDRSGECSFQVVQTFEFIQQKCTPFPAGL